ncbi:MAG: hypothetical protein EAZ49_02510 [Oscillatoriales cyanobacterium]|nr:MAG: hypothetical protein EAZ49_02510 [Oscillatoriales cyanobacterium]
MGRHRILSGAVLTKADSLKGFQPHSANSGVRLKYSRAQVKQDHLKKIDQHRSTELIFCPIAQNINQDPWVKPDPPLACPLLPLKKQGGFIVVTQIRYVVALGRSFLIL